MTIVQDDRTDKQRLSHRTLVVATDAFMSGWGHAKGGTSIAAWACTAKQAPACEARIRQRREMKRVRVVVLEGKRTYRPPQTCAHCHIYVEK